MKSKCDDPYNVFYLGMLGDTINDDNEFAISVDIGAGVTPTILGVWDQSGNFSVLNDLISKNNINASVDITAEGDMYCTTLYETSDGTMKENVSDLEDPLKRVNELRPVSFNFIDTGDTPVRPLDKKNINYGFIAQEVEETSLSDIVTETDKHKWIRRADIIPFLVGSIKELTSKIIDLEKKINSLASI